MSGFEVLRSLRVSKIKTPILILSGLPGIEDKVRGLGFGADDYMTKPFHKDELVAHIQAIVRRSKGHAQSTIHTGDLIVNIDTKTVSVNGAPVHLTGKECSSAAESSQNSGSRRSEVCRPVPHQGNGPDFLGDLRFLAARGLPLAEVRPETHPHKICRTSHENRPAATSQ
jgi:Response regulator receiver domain